MMEKTVRRGTRTGFTTGACSAAAAAAAVQGLVHGAVPEMVDCLLPNGDTVRFAVKDGRCDASTPSATAGSAGVVAAHGKIAPSAPAMFRSSASAAANAFSTGWERSTGSACPPLAASRRERNSVSRRTTPAESINPF